MFDTSDVQSPVRGAEDARVWVKRLATYRDASTGRSIFELAVTLIPFIALWAVAWASMSVSYWLTFVIALSNGPFLLRLFAIQHDCGHGAFFQTKKANDFLGRILGVLTLTPYAVWRQSHNIHHAGSGNLDRRGIGDISTLTVAEYRARTKAGKLLYRLYRNPLVLFGLGPAYLFLLQNRLPLGFTDQRRFWVSAMGTNLALLTALAAIVYFGGLPAFLLIFLPTTLLAATAGMWLFYVQHQFEETVWDEELDWQVHDAALHGSSHYIMPQPLKWFSANIGIHHVHHLYSRIPFYRLPEVLNDYNDLATANRMTIPESIACARLHLWDENGKRLLSFKDAAALPA